MTCITQPMSSEERDQHIIDCTALFMDAYARFEDHGLRSDRDAALQWLHIRDQAARERVLDQCPDFFSGSGSCYFEESHG